MTPRIYVMWALGNLVAVLIAIGAVMWTPMGYAVDLSRAIWEDGRTYPDPEPVPMREPGWVLKEYRERWGYLDLRGRADAHLS
jgi:hypothetical protein